MFIGLNKYGILVKLETLDYVTIYKDGADLPFRLTFGFRPVGEKDTPQMYKRFATESEVLTAFAEFVSLIPKSLT